MRGAQLAALAALALGCASAEEEFTAGRLETLCGGAIPICRQRAGCVLDGASFARGRFPGAQQVIVRAPAADARLRVRLLLNDLVHPGTELLVQVHGLGCGGVEQARLVDVDFFRLAGDDGVLDFTLPLDEAGDHLLEVYADMSAAYVIQVDVQVDD
ncbi:MAG: hypothetical protein H6706_21350 [Myxococcales bacterium]|nr:hypothetical protein [Myxococcales bacterium]